MPSFRNSSRFGVSPPSLTPSANNVRGVTEAWLRYGMSRSHTIETASLRSVPYLDCENGGHSHSAASLLQLKDQENALLFNFNQTLVAVNQDMQKLSDMLQSMTVFQQSSASALFSETHT